MNAGGVPPVVTWAIVTTGGFLIYAAVRGVSPLAELSAVLRGQTAPPAQPLGVSVAVGGPTVDVAAPNISDAPVGTPSTAELLGSAFASGAGAVPTDLTSIVNNPGAKLRQAAAAAFAKWTAAYGRPIYVSDAYRSYAIQKQAYDAQAPGENRFAPPDKSWHVKGLAVDVDLAKSGAGNETGAGFKALYAAAVATGWCNPRGPSKGDHREPWHFSYGGCG